MKIQGLSLTMIFGIIGLLVMIIFISSDSISKFYRFPPTYFNSDYFEITHFNLDLKADFDLQLLKGNITFFIKSKVKIASKISFDIGGQKINSIKIGNNSNHDNFNIFKTDATSIGLGEKLEIIIPKDLCGSNCKNFEIIISIIYETNPNLNGQGNNFLTPNQTFFGIHPFYYTYCYPVFCRQIFPMHDSLLLSSTFNATVMVLPPLKVWMSADYISEEELIIDEKVFKFYKFSQKIKLSSYLFNMIIGVMNETNITSDNKIKILCEEPNLNKFLSLNLDSKVKVIEKILFALPFDSLFIVMLPKAFPDFWLYCPGLAFLNFNAYQLDYREEMILLLIILHYFQVQIQITDWNLLYLTYGYATYVLSQVYREINPSYSKLIVNSSIEEMLSEMQTACKDEQSKYLTELKPNLYGMSPVFYSENMTSIRKGLLFFLRLENLTSHIDLMKFTREFLLKYNYSKIEQKLFQEEFLHFIKNNDNYPNKGLAVRKKIEWQRWLIKKCDVPWIPYDLIVKEIDEVKILSDIYSDNVINNQTFDNLIKYKSYSSRLKYNFLWNFYERIYQYTNDSNLILFYAQKFENDFNKLNESNCDVLSIYINFLIYNTLELDSIKDFIMSYVMNCFTVTKIYYLFEGLIYNNYDYALNFYYEINTLFHEKTKIEIENLLKINVRI